MLRRPLDAGMTLIRSRRFPMQGHGSPLRHDAVIGIGGNVGDVFRRFHRLLEHLRRNRFIDVVATSPILQNPPFGHTDQEDFLNAVIVIRTSLLPRALMRELLRIEKRFGRIRTFPNAPRTLDLDILFYEDRVVNSATVTIPHPHWHERPSVLIPLAWVMHHG